MSSKPRYVFDTNVIISALLLAKSPPGHAFYAARARGEILLSQAVVEELADVLSRRKFDRYIGFEERERFLEALIQEATLVEIITGTD
jgi:putative PIN family toxin of toxin-antitoxin system